MAASSVSLSSQLQSPSISTPPSHSVSSNTVIRFQLRTPRFRLQASRRPPNFRQYCTNWLALIRLLQITRPLEHDYFVDQKGESLVVNLRNRGQNRKDIIFVGDYDDDDDEEEEADRSLDLLIRFVNNVYKKISKRARKAVRSILPINIPTKLVAFSVNGVLILAFLWILRAFLEVVCTFGIVVFISILVVRGVWTGISYFQEGSYHRIVDPNDANQAWTGAQPAA